MPEVDYGRPDVARRYSQGRGLPADVLDRWRDAVVALLPPRERYRVLDLGAGTGIFSRAWPRWCPCEVVAVEPAAGMREVLGSAGVPAVRVVAGRSEELPLRRSSVDVAWLSAVVHHIGDLDRCAAELRRVTLDGGTVLLRGLFADLGHVPWLDHFPGRHRSLARFPDVDGLRHRFERHDLHLTATREVADVGAGTAGAAAEAIRRLRHADTLLVQLTDEEVDAGIAALGALGDEHPLAPVTLGLVAFRAGR